MPEEMSPEGEGGAASKAIVFQEFLESTPPGVSVEISDLRTYRNAYVLAVPRIQLHCGSDHCGGLRFFGLRGQAPYFPIASLAVFLDYICRNCSGSLKTYAAIFTHDATETSGTGIKFGEFPAFGPPTPGRLIALVGPDREAFLKGRRAENEGLGIGAFAYYRRVVENQKDRLLDEIIRVATKTQARPEIVATLEAARRETQFSKAMEMAKDAIPDTLRIDGHNPLSLLHSALSEGLHAKSDEDCLEIATSIRVVLQDLAERSAAALKDHAELKTALSRLLNRK